MDQWMQPAALAFAAGVIYHAGYLAARVAHLEEWRNESRQAFDAIHTALRELRDMYDNRPER
jgi:hypothetical protein